VPLLRLLRWLKADAAAQCVLWLLLRLLRWLLRLLLRPLGG
jgi:hypothetical protein